MTQGARASFVVRVVQNRRGQINGVIERVATGGKEAFTDMDAIGRIILKMLGHDDTPPRSGARAQPVPEKPRPGKPSQE
jgi:hypothetical protein